MRRRTLLQALGSLPLAIPLLDVTQESRAAAGADKRLVLVTTQNGMINEHLFPESGLFPKGEKAFGTGPGEVDLGAGQTLASMADLQSELLLVTGLDFPGKEEHGAIPILAGTQSKEATQGFDTVDQIAGRLLEGSSTQRSINLGVAENAGDKVGRVSSASNSNGRRMPFHNTPRDAYEALFDNFAPSTGENEVAPQVEDRRQVLGLMNTRLQTLRSGLGQEDAQRIEWHLDAMSELERGLVAIGPSDSCSPPELQEGSDVPEISKFMMALTVQGLACGITNVVNFSFGGSAEGSIYSWLRGKWPDPSGRNIDSSESAIKEGHHALSHNAGVYGTRDRHKAAKKSAIDRWHAEQFELLLRSLKAVNMPGGESLWESTTAVWLGENRDQSHTRHDMHFLVGGAGSGFRPGRILRLSNTPRTDWDGENEDNYQGTFGNNFWFSLLKSMGSEADSFGDADWFSGEISELTA